MMSVPFRADQYWSWSTSKLLAHELGHVLIQMFHTFSTSQLNGSGIYDVNAQNDPGLNCTNGNSNNIMGYNSCRSYLSPQQIGKVHRLVHTGVYTKFTPLCIYDNTNNIVIDESYQGGTTSIVWESSKAIGGDLIIKPGFELTIKCDVFMPKDGKIIIERGGKLILDGGTISNACNELWQGIEVWGDRTLRQLQNMQGIVNIINGGMIENARDAITTSKKDVDGNIDWNFTGGIVQCQGAIFRNNRRSAEFLSYHNTATNGNEIANLSFFKNCVFETTRELNDIDNPFPIPFITMFDMKGIKFQGNTFQNTSTGIAIQNLGCGIGSIDASYTVSSLNGNKNKFINLLQGIYSTQTTSTSNKNVSISNSEFNNVYQGITGNMFFSSISGNTFNIPSYTTSNGIGAWGIYLDGAVGFGVSDNVFNGNSVTDNFGVIVKNSASFGGSVSFNNKFNNLAIAIQTEQENPLLKIRCNEFQGNETAWSVNPLTTGSVLANQGNACGNTAIKAGNLFYSCSDNTNKISSYLINPFQYYAWGNPSTTIPCVDPGASGIMVNNCVGTTIDRRSCVSKIPVDALAVAQLKVEMKKENDPVEKQNILSELIRYHLQNDETSSVIQLLIESNTIEAKKILAATYIDRMELAKAKHLLDQLPDNIQSELNFKTYHNLVKDLKSQGKKIIEMTAQEELTVRSVASSTSNVSAQAKAALEVSKGEKIERIPETRILSTARLASNDQIEFEIAVKSNEAALSVNYPNPFDNSTIIESFIPETNQSSQLIIFDLSGKKIKEFTLKQGNNQLIISSQDLENGTYLYSLIIDGQNIKTRRMVVLK